MAHEMGLRNCDGLLAIDLAISLKIQKMLQIERYYDLLDVGKFVKQVQYR